MKTKFLFCFGIVIYPLLAWTIAPINTLRAYVPSALYVNRQLITQSASIEEFMLINGTIKEMIKNGKVTFSKGIK